jgi:hypothetical protein
MANHYDLPHEPTELMVEVAIQNGQHPLDMFQDGWWIDEGIPCEIRIATKDAIWTTLEAVPELPLKRYPRALKLLTV